MIPKVKFTVGWIDDSYVLEVIMHFIISGESSGKLGDTSKLILSHYPTLGKKLEGSKKSERKEIVRGFFRKFEAKNKHVYEQVRKEFQEIWDKVNDRLMIALEEINEIKWGKENFVARVASNPIGPRYLQDEMFDIPFFTPDIVMPGIVLHELSHFIFFKKWKKMFPKWDEDEFESPHLLWKLSEIIPYVVLGDERIQKIYDREPPVYDIWHKTRIKDKPLLKWIQEIYDSRKNFEDFVRKSWKFVQDNQDSL